MRQNVNFLREIEEDGRIYPNEFDDEIGKLEDFATLMKDVLLHPLLTEGTHFYF